MSLSASIAKADTKNLDSNHNWRQVLRKAWRKPEELLDYLQLDSSLLKGIAPGQQQFPLLAPSAFIEQIEKGNPEDPLFLQIFPQAAEARQQSGLLQDPVGDIKSQASPGLLHKYHSRALVITTGACAIHCRYCFRRHFPYTSVTGGRSDWQQSLDYIRANPNISEIILSGGDPLMLATAQLEKISRSLLEFPQLKTLRIHTRIASCLPERINTRLVHWLRELPWAVVFVHHINHPQEIGSAAELAFTRLQSCTQMQLNQSVLLQGVNNKAEVLIQLSEKLFGNSVTPYYLHQMDQVQGAGHFNCSDIEARQLMRQLRAAVPGYLVPRLVREVTGEPGKTPV